MDVELVLLVLLVDEVEPELIHIPSRKQMFQDFFFLLVDVELVVEVVPIKKHVHRVSIFNNTQMNQRQSNFRFEIHGFFELREL